MKKYLLLLVFLLTTNFIFSQENTYEKPNYQNIAKNIYDRSSNLFYPKLWERFQEGDTSMILEEKRHLYYGYSLNEKYNPYDFSNQKEHENIMKLLAMQIDAKDAKFEKIASLIKKVLDKEPFNIRYMSILAYYYKGRNLLDEYDKVVSQINIISDAISSSGDGKSKESPVFVIYIGNEYIMLK